MSDATVLSDTVGDATVSTALAPEGDRWMSVVKGGAWDGYVSVMDKAGDPHALHDGVIALLSEPLTP